MSENNLITEHQSADQSHFIKTYPSTIDGKRNFVSEVLSPFLVQAATGWYGAKYECRENCEIVHLITAQGWKSIPINVTGDSLAALVRDVFRKI